MLRRRRRGEKVLEKKKKKNTNKSSRTNAFESHTVNTISGSLRGRRQEKKYIEYVYNNSKNNAAVSRTKPNVKHSDGSAAAGENESCPDRGV